MTIIRTLTTFALIAVMSNSFVLQAQTAREWDSQSKSDSAGAAVNLEHAFSVAQVKAVEHYRKVGNTERAEIVVHLKPNKDELIGRLSIAAKAQPNADIVDVMRGYIVDASKDLMTPTKH